MAWTTISNAAVAVGGIPSSATVTALRDNPGAMAAAETGAPAVYAGWHPYNKVTVGDGTTGIIYDFAVNGVQASIVTPDFEDGYEYRIVCRDMSHNSGSSQSLQVEFADSGGSYVDDASTGAASNSAEFFLDLITFMPRVAAEEMPVLIVGSGVTVPIGRLEMGNSKILRARISYTGGSIDRGKIWLLRQTCHVSNP